MEEKNVHSIFLGSIVLKGIGATLEIIGGILLLFTGAITHSIQLLTQGELAEDPHDLIANSVQHYLPYLHQHSQLFASLYLLSHGIVKVFLVAGLIRNKLWAYPASFIVFSLFIIYQLYRFLHTHSMFLILLTIFDIAVIWLTWHEYKVVKKNTLHLQK